MPPNIAGGLLAYLGINIEPLISTDPVNLCVSSPELPNLVEPLSKIIEAEINSV